MDTGDLTQTQPITINQESSVGPGVPYRPEPPVEDQGVPYIADPTSRSPVSGDTARNRAMKMHIGLGESSPGIDVLENSILTGREKSLRQQISVQMKDENRVKLERNLQKLMATGVVDTATATNIQRIIQNPPSEDPEVVVEKSFAEKFTQSTMDYINKTQNDAATKAFEADKDGVLRSIKGTDAIIARKEVARKVFEDIQTIYDKQGWGEWSKNFAKGFIPGVYGTEMSPDWNPGNILLPGQTMQDEIQKFWGIKDLAEASRWLNARVQAIAKSNPNTALEYAHNMMSFSSGQIMTANVFGLMDAQGVGGVGQVAVVAIKARGLRKALMDSTKAIDPVTGKIDAIDRIATTGDLRGASQAKATKDLLRQADPTFQAEEVYNQVKLVTRPDLIEGVNTPAASRQRARELMPYLNETSEKIAGALTKGTWAERLQEGLVKQAANEAEEMFRIEHPYVSDSILDVSIKVHPVTHTRYIEVQLGTKDKRLFSSVQDAEKYAFDEYGFDFQRVAIGSDPSSRVVSAAKTRLSNDVVNKGMAVENARIAAQEGRPTAGPTQFQTSMGSTYTVHGDGTTTRMKKARPEHTKTVWANKDTDIPVEVLHAEKPVAGGDGRMYQAVKYDGKKSYVPSDELKTVFDQGLKDKSAKTVYLTQDQANRLAPPQGTVRIAEHNDGTLSTLVKNESGPNAGKWGVSPSSSKVPYSTEPAKGLIPLELWRKPDSASKKLINQWVGQTPVYREHHFGNKITEVMASTQDETDALIAKLSGPSGQGASFLPGDQALHTANMALNSAARMEIKQEGANHYISIVKPLNETSSTIRDNIIKVGDQNVNPVNVANMFLGAIFRSAEDQLAYFQRNARHMTTHIPQEMMRVFKDIAKNIGTLKGKDFEALNLVLERNRDFTSYVNAKPVRGQAYTNQFQLEKAWLDVNGKLPTEQQSLAYWSYHQLMATDWMIRNFGVHRDLLRQGVEHFTFDVKNIVKNKAGKDEESLGAIFAPGRFEKDLPWNHREDFGVNVNIGGDTTHHYIKSMPDAVKDQIRAKVSSGEWKVIQVGNPADRPFESIVGPGKTVNFVVTDTYRSKPLPMNLVDWNPGVHVVYPHPFFVKQPIMAVGEKGLLRYYGDKVIYAADNEKQAAEWSKNMTELQTMLREKKPDADMQAFISKNLPEDLAFWKQRFGSFLSVDHPIGPVYTGKTFFEQHPHLKPVGLTDERHSEFNLFGSINMDFLANRDGPLNTIVKGGTADLPVYKTERARTLDPFKSLTRGLVTGVDSLVMNDAKFAAIEQWVSQYKHLLPNADEASRNPMQAFYGFKPNQSLMTRPDLASAVNTRERTIQFLGSSTEFGKDLNWIQQKMMNSMGPDLARWYNDHELRSLKDPLGFTKSWLFNFKFGFLNPAQFIVQSAGFAHVMAVSGPGAASRGVSGYILARALQMTDEPAVINRLNGIARNMGWKGDTFKEAYTTMRATGWDIIGREHAMSDHTFDPNIFRNGFNTALEWGRLPFTEGDRLTRETAWFSAFHEWRLKNPNKVVDNFATAEIITRADDLSSNMTKASHARMQEGVLGTVSQFYTFSHRMLEQFWGGRLTPTEKARAALTHSILFGLPITAAIGIPWPVNDSLKQHLMETGSPLLDNGWYKAATEGFLSWATHMVTGTEYNVEQRYGPGFGDILKKFVDGETSAVDFIGGASGSFVKALAKSLYPLYAHVAVGMMGGQEEYPLAKDDVMEVLREISSVNNFHNAYYAYSTGKYFSRNQTFIDDGLNATDAAMMVLGLTKKSITDVRLTLGGLKEQKDAQQKIQIMAEKEFKRAFLYMGDGDWQKADTHMMRAKALMIAIGDFPDAMVRSTLQKVMEEGTPLATRIKKDFTEKGNKSQLPARLQRLYDGPQPSPIPQGPK